MNPTYIFEGHLVAEQPLATCSKDLMDTAGKNAPTPIPMSNTARGRAMYFPATGIKGAIRRACLSAIRERIIEKTGNKTPFTLDEHLLLSSGGIKGGEKTVRKSVAQHEVLLAANPQLALFGAGAAGVLGFVEGKIGIGNAFCDPDLVPDVFSGARVDEFTRSSHNLAYLSPADIEQLIVMAETNSQASPVRQKIKKLEADLAKALSAKSEQAAEIQTELDAQKVALNKLLETEGASSNSLQRALSGYRAIPAGATMAHRMQVFRASDVELGLLLLGLKQFALERPMLGAHIGTGCGMVSGQWELSRVTTKGRESLGAVSMAPYVGLMFDHPDIGNAMAAADIFIRESDKANFGIPELGV